MLSICSTVTLHPPDAAPSNTDEKLGNVVRFFSAPFPWLRSWPWQSLWSILGIEIFGGEEEHDENPSSAVSLSSVSPERRSSDEEPIVKLTPSAIILTGPSLPLSTPAKPLARDSLGGVLEVLLLPTLFKAPPTPTPLVPAPGIGRPRGG